MIRSLLTATCLITVAQLATQAHAQQAPAAQANAGTTIGEVVVTAEKREQSLQQVPVAVSAYTATRRDIIGINTVQDLTNFTPGFSYSTSLDRAFIRGIGRETNNLATDAGVATYVDSFYNQATVAAAGDSLFIQRIEILRGPQGTLYGRNSIGGTVNAISFRPTDTYYAEGRGGYGNYGAYKGEVAVSGPITDHFRFRLAAEDIGQTRGYFTNVANNTTEGGNDESKYIEVQFAADAGPFEAWIKADALDFHGHDLLANDVGSYDYNKYNTLAAITVNAPFGYTLPGFTELGTATQNPGITNIREVNAAINNRAFEKAYNFTTQLTWHLSGADIRYIGGYTHYHYHFTDDGGWLANGVANSVTSFTLPSGLEIFPVTDNYYDEAKSYWSNEIDIVSTGNGPVQWVVGGYQYQEHFYQDLIFAQLQQAQLEAPFYALSLVPFILAPAPLNLSRDAYYTTQTMTSNSLAVFGQVDWKFTDTLKFTGGIRYNHDRKNGFEHARIQCFDGILCPLDGAFGPFTPDLDITPAFVAGAAAVPNAPGVTSPVTIDPATGIATRGLGASWSAVTGTAGLEWTPDRETLVYGKYARGYKEGGFATGGFSIQPESFPETVDAFEVGAKKQFGGRFQANVSAYYYLYHNKQDPLSVQTEAGPNVTELVNLSKVTLAGVELETIWQPIDNLQILLNYAHIYSRINTPGQCFADVNDRFAQLPGDNISGCPAPVPAFPLPNSQTQNLTGEQAPEATPNKVTLNGNYTFRLPAGNLTFSATYIWKDATYYSIFNRPWNLAPSYSQVDLRASFTDSKNRFTIIAYAKNVTNALGYDNALGFSTAQAFPFVPVNVAQIYGPTPPRTYGFEVQVRFR